MKPFRVTIDGFDYYVSDDKPKLGEFYIDDANQIRQAITDDEEYWDRRSGYKIIIATTNPKIDIPKVVDGVEKLSLQSNEFYDVFEIGFKSGYNKSQETHPFSEEDMIEFLNYYQKTCLLAFNSSGQNHGKTTKELLQLWKEQRTKIGYYNG